MWPVAAPKPISSSTSGLRIMVLSQGRAGKLHRTSFVFVVLTFPLISSQYKHAVGESWPGWPLRRAILLFYEGVKPSKLVGYTSARGHEVYLWCISQGTLPPSFRGQLIFPYNYHSALKRLSSVSKNSGDLVKPAAYWPHEYLKNHFYLCFKA